MILGASRGKRSGENKNIYRMFQNEPYNGIPNAAVWPVLQKRLHLREYKLSIIRHLK
jgi:hypothetical protein